MRPPVRFAHSGDVAIAYTHVGEGPIDLLYLSTLNNLDLTWENPLYAGFLQRIAEHARLIALDRRGQGISDRLSPKDIPLLEDNVDDVIAVLDAVGSERAVLMGGSDLGALCTLLAASYPERVAGLILFAANPCGEQAFDYPWQWSGADWDAYLDDMRRNWGTRRFAADNLPLFCPSLAGDEQQLEWFERFLRGTASGNVQLAIENVMRRIDVRPLLPSIGVPTLVMHRVDDRIEDVGASRYLAQAIRGARYVELEGATTSPGRARRSPCSPRSSASSPGWRTSRPPRPTACSQPSCSRTSSTRPPTPRRSATGSGAPRGSRTTGSSAGISPASGARR
jgi:pimeloyl-ACP methyl ester carboxylesterase